MACAAERVRHADDVERPRGRGRRDLPRPDPDRHHATTATTPGRGSGRPPSTSPRCSPRSGSTPSSSSPRPAAPASSRGSRASDPLAPALAACTATSTSSRATPTTGRSTRSPARSRDGCVWGRGAVDMKDMDAMMLAVVRRLRPRAGASPRATSSLVLPRRRGGRRHATAPRWLVDNHRELFEGGTEAIGEVGGFSSTVGGRRLYLIEAAEKGMAWMRLRRTAAPATARWSTTTTRSPGSPRPSRGSARTSGRCGSPRPCGRFLDGVGRAPGIELDPDDPERRSSTSSARRPASSARPCATPPTRRCSTAGYKTT